MKRFASRIVRVMIAFLIVNIYFYSSNVVGFSNANDEVTSTEEPLDGGEDTEGGEMMQLEEEQGETELHQGNEEETQEEVTESVIAEAAITKSEVAEVKTWDEFTAALQDVEISVIDVKADIDREYGDRSKTGGIARSLTINGNGHKINLGTDTGYEVPIILNAVTEATNLILNDVIFIKGQEGHPIFFRYSDEASRNWNIILKGVNSGEGNVAGLVIAPNATVTVYGENHFTTGGQTHHFHVRNFEVTEGASLTATSSGRSYAAIYIVSGKVDVRANASLKIVNTGRSVGEDTSNQPKYSHGLYGSIRSLNLEENSLLDIDVTNTAYRTNVSNELNMKAGAIFHAKSKYQSAIALCSDYGEGNKNQAKITIAGQGTELNLTTESTSKKMFGAAMRVAGDNSEVHVTDGAVVRSYSKFGTGIQLQGDGIKVHVKNDAEIDIVQEGDSGDNTKAALYQDISGDQNIQIDKAEVRVTKRSGLAPAVRLYGGNSQVDVINGGRLVVHNAGDGIANNGLLGDGSGNHGIFHTGGAGSFFLDGKGSTVEITADYGPAIVASGSTSVTAKEDTVLILKGQTSSGSAGILSSLKRVTITIDNPMYFDFRNNRPGGGYIFNSSDQSSTFTATNADLSVWKKGSDLDGVATAIWTKFDYTLSGGSFSKIAYTNIPELFHADTYLGTQQYSRMSVNTASAIIDELRVPTDADKYIYLHASILGGVVESRDAWTDEVYATVLVKDEKGEVVCTLDGASVGADDTSKGLSVYNEEARAGIIKILYDPDEDGVGDFLPAGYTVEVGSVDYSSVRMSLADKDSTIHKRNMKTPIVTVRDVTPPNPVMLDESSQMISTHTKEISGTSDEAGATIRVKVNGKWVTEGSGIIKTTVVDASGMWIFPLPKLEENDIVAIYASDNKGADEVHDVIQPPVTSGELGNINPDEEMTYHDATFPAKVEVQVVDGGSLIISSAPTNISFGELEISSLDQSYAVRELDQDFIVTDNKVTKGKWRMTATLLSELHNSDKKHTIENGLVYYRGESKLALNKAKTVIYEHAPFSETCAEEAVNISDSWSENEGLFLEVPGGSAKIGEYGAVIQWSLEDVPSN